MYSIYLRGCYPCRFRRHDGLLCVLFLLSNKNSDFSSIETDFVPKSTRIVRKLKNLRLLYRILLHREKFFKCK